MRKAYSYQRFSSIKQKGGDSTRRQSGAAEIFCKQHDLTLVDTFTDEGVSGFKGKNFSNESALSQFLKLLENGKVEQGSVLIVENMDRLSRQSILPCLSKFIEIINKRVSIGVISQNKILDTKSITENPMELMLVLVEFARANNESEIRDGKMKIIAYHEIFSPTREILRDRTGQILGRFESDTGVTRDVSGKIIGRGSNQLLRLLK
jgi:DNA invertase Pin-like site-specific DNA recombinase